MSGLYFQYIQNPLTADTPLFRITDTNFLVIIKDTAYKLLIQKLLYIKPPWLPISYQPSTSSDNLER